MKRKFIIPHQREQLREFVAGLPKDRRYTVTIEPYKKPRSVDANAFWWACVVTPLAEACGYTPQEMHTELCGSFFGWKEVEFRGHKRAVPRRTTTTPDVLGTMEFADLIHHGQSIAAEMGVQLPNEEAAA